MNAPFAYLDPGTLTFLMQCLVAVVVSCTLYLGIFWNHIKAKCASVFQRTASESNEPDTVPFNAKSEVGSNETNEQKNAA